LQAGNTLTLQAGQKSNDMAWGSQTTSSGFLSSSTTTRRETASSTQSIGTNVGGNTVNVTANQDINIKGSSVIADTNATLSAGNNINIEAATNTARNTSFVETKESGFLSGGGFGISYGKREQSTDQKNQNTTAAASTVGAIGGNVNINAGQTFRQVGSDIVAPTGDINITAKKVDIIEERETSSSTTEQKFKQSGITLSVSSPVVSAVQNAQAMSKAASQTSDGRMQALAAASTALNVYNNAKDIGQAIADPVGSASINVSIGSSKSQSNSTSQSDTARGSSIAAGNNVNITATGADKSAGQQSDVTIQGSSVKAGNNTTLTADNQINLLAAKNESSQTSTNSNSSSSIGASFSAKGISANASISRGSGESDGQDTTFTNTNVSAGNTATITSGGDTNVIGAVVSANTIKANIGGSLKVESLQDTSTFSSSQKSANASISVPITGGSFGGSVGASKSNVDSNFQSVGQQSGLKAANGGFQVDVAKNTALVGAVIASNQAALDNARNSFRTGGSLSITDIQNTASFKGKAVGVSLDLGQKPGGGTGTTGLGVGLGSTGGNAASTSTAGISGIAGNTAVRTGDAETGLKPIFDAAKVQRDINAQAAITQAFSKEAPKAVATFSDNQAKDLRKAGKEEEAKKWDEGGTLRVALHTLMGAFSGGATGALGAAASASAAPLMNQLQDGIASSLQTAGLSADAAKGIASGIAGLTAAGVGAAVGGAQGAATAATVDFNNRQLHPTERQWARDNATKYRDYLKTKTGESVSTEEAYQRLLSAGYAIVDKAAANTGKSDEAAKQFINQNSGSLFVATAAERANPFLNGNPDGTFSPEQQARYGVKNPTELANKRIEVANQVAGKSCDFVSCTAKVDAIAGAVSALEQEKALYQNDAARVRQIEVQQNQLLLGLSKQDIEKAQLASADAAFMMDLLMLPQAVGLINGVTRAAMLNKVVGRTEGGVGANGGVPAVSKIDLAPPPNSYPVYTRGAGAAEGPLPPGYTTVSRWVSPEEASLWVQNQGTAIPAAIPRNGTPQLYVTQAGAPYPPGANGTVRIDFAVPDKMLKTGNAPNNFMILQPSSSTPIYNVNIHVPNGVTLPKAR
jgi:filamentous hemagglutinin